MPSVLSSLSLGSLLAFVPTVIAGFSPSSNTNIAIYWGQNSNGQANSQQRLSYYCQNSELDIIPLAFLTSIANPAVNFASATNDCTAISGSNLVSCPEIASDIVTCQQTYGKTILLSVGGATYSEGGFSSSSDAVAAANNLWAIFGPPTSSSAPRPFGDSVIDGFDLDFESTFSNGPAFANQLRSNMNSDTSKPYYLTAAPQCPYPDSADGPMLAGAVSFDAVFVQFYNNYCQTTSYTAGSSSQNNFDFSTWDNWAKTVSLNPNVKVFLGIPGSSTAAGSGYESASALADVISYSKSFSSFGGLMIWDASQVWANTGFLDGVNSDLGNAAATTFATVTMRSTTITSSPGTSTSSGAQPTQSTVAEYDQCGGQGYTGSTVCASPYVCIYHSTYYSECQVAGSSPDITRPGNNATHVRLLRPAPVVN